MNKGASSTREVNVGWSSQHRKRSIRALCCTAVVAAASLLPSALSLSTPVFTTRRGKVKTTRKAPLKPSDRPLDDYVKPTSTEEPIFDSLSGFQQLQQSTGSEVLESHLQKQIDEATSSPDLFLDKHTVDASLMEKVAMSSVTAQLPQRAVKAFQNNLNFAGERVTHEEELQLARLIQKGVALNAIRGELATKLQREPTKQEWADAVELSPKELRRQISSYRKAKHDLVSANMGLVHAVVNQQWLQYSTSGISREELVQEGSLGLIRAAELFDPSRGLRFSTYAVVWIKGTLSNSHVPELVRLPQRERTKWNKILRANKELKASGGHKPSLEELAAATGLTVEQVMATERRMASAQHVLSLDYEHAAQSRSGTETSTMGTSLQNDKNFQADADLAERTQMQADIIAALARNLDAREARLMRLRYGLSDGNARSLHECAEAMGLSYTRVQQLARKCLDKLRKAAEAESLEEYLLTIA